MDSEILVILPPAQAAHAEQVRELFAEWEARLSRFRADSDLSRLNASAGRPIETRDPLTHVLRRALRAAAATGGVFDPTLGRDLRDAGYAQSFQHLGAAAEARKPGERISSWRDVRIGALGVVSVPFDLSIDLGGIAKGMAVDAALNALQAEGVDYALVSAGGDLAVRGTLPGGRPWPVSISLAQRDMTVTLAGGALATSSTQKRSWQTEAGPMHHLIDPRTRRPSASGLVRATVHAPTCQAAEVAAKTALILGLEDGRRFLDRHGLAGVLSTPDVSHTVGAWPAERAQAA